MLRRMLASVFAALTCWLGAVAVSANAAEVTTAVFDRIGADALAANKAPGFSFAVVRDGRIAYAKGFGFADVQHEVPVGVDTRFAIGSITKQFTAAAILLLVQRGKVGLFDPVARYLPAFPNGAAITVGMLLNQTSGLHSYPFLGEHPWPLSGPVDVAAVVSLLATDQPDFAPGTRWEYSNANYALLAAIVAKAGGVSEAEFLQRNIFDPLKMNASGFGYVAQQRPGVATAYQGAAPFVAQSPIGLDLYSGAGAMISNAPDLAAWDIALMNGKLLDAGSMQALWTAGTLPSGAPVPYAMGFVPTALAGHREVWHNGLAPGAGGYCFNAIFPDDKLAVIVLSNGYDFDGVPERMVAGVLAAYDPAAAAQIAASAPPSPAPGEDPEVTARAKDWWHRLQTGTVDLARVDARFAHMLTPEFLAQVKASLAGQGTPTDWIYIGSTAVPGATVYRYWVRVGGVPHVWSVGLTPGGMIAGSQLQ